MKINPLKLKTTPWLCYCYFKFWKQKYISSPKNCVRYQRQIIRYCLALVVKSLSLYDGKRFDGNDHTHFLMITRRQCLKDCKNYIGLAGGFNEGFNGIKELCKDVGTTRKKSIFKNWYGINIQMI